jgi:two-component system LytT family response regulator
MRVLIVDDEPPARRKIRRFLEDSPGIDAIAEAGAGREALEAIRSFRPDLLFLDVQMPDMDGFAVLQAVPPPREFHVVFLTAHDHHALRAFEAEALDYLLKPADPERFERVLERARQQVALRQAKPAEPALPPPSALPTPPALPPHFARRLLVEKGGKELFLPVEQLDWAEADRNYICLHAGRETYTLRATLESLVRQLDPDQFARISRSELVNLDRIREMQPWFHGERRIILKDGKELTWTRRFRAQRFLA